MSNIVLHFSYLLNGSSYCLANSSIFSGGQSGTVIPKVSSICCKTSLISFSDFDLSNKFIPLITASDDSSVTSITSKSYDSSGNSTPEHHPSFFECNQERIRLNEEEEFGDDTVVTFNIPYTDLTPKTTYTLSAPLNELEEGQYIMKLFYDRT